MNRTTIYLIVLLLALGCIVWLMLPSEKERESSYVAEPINLTIDSASVVKLEIQHPGKSATIENVGGRWTITAPVNYVADESAVKQIISGLMKFKVGSLISSNPEKQAVFQVDTSGTKVTVTERGGKATSIIIGKMGPSFSEVYVRIPASKDVYLGEGIDTWMVSKDVKDWRDKSIISTPSESIRNLTYVAGNKQYDFHRDSTSWKSGDKTIDGNVMNPALSSLSNLRADDFVDAETSIPSHPVTLKIQAADEVTLSLYPVLPDSSKYYVRKSSSNQLYVVSKYTVQQILKPVGQHAAVSKPAEPVASVPQEEPPPKQVVSHEPPRKEIAKSAEPIVTSPPKEVETKPAQTSSTPTMDVHTRAIQSANTATKRPKRGPAGQTTTQTTTQNAIQTTAPKQNEPPPVTEPAKTQTTPKQSAAKSTASLEDEGELTVHTVKRGETMQIIAKQYNVSVEQILKWNLLKTIAVRPGQELYVYVHK